MPRFGHKRKSPARVAAGKRAFARLVRRYGSKTAALNATIWRHGKRRGKGKKRGKRGRRK